MTLMRPSLSSGSSSQDQCRDLVGARSVDELSGALAVAPKLQG